LLAVLEHRLHPGMGPFRGGRPPTPARGRGGRGRALRALECTYFAWARTDFRCVSTTLTIS